MFDKNWHYLLSRESVVIAIAFVLFILAIIAKA
jgi:hypothetical protein